MHYDSWINDFVSIVSRANFIKPLCMVKFYDSVNYGHRALQDGAQVYKISHDFCSIITIKTFKNQLLF